MEHNTQKQDSDSIKDYEQIRKNWKSYNQIYTDITEYDAIWDDWIKKHKQDENNVYYKILKRFVESIIFPDKQKATFQDFTNGNHIQVAKKSQYKISLRGLDGDERKDVHLLCDIMGLHHVSENYRGKRELCIIMPKGWSWEFSPKNPYIPWKARKYCSECGVNGLEAQLMCSPYILDIFCEDCIEDLSDGEGGELSDHKFEPI